MSFFFEEKEYNRPFALIEDKVLKKYIADESGIVLIPEEVEVIASGAFSWVGMPEDQYDDWEPENDQCISEIHIPATVKEIEPEAFVDLFYLKQLFVDESCPAVIFEDEVLYSPDKKRIIFASPKLDRSYRIPDGVEIIEPYSFMGRHIDKLEIPDSVRFIADGAFSGAFVHNIVIPDSVTEIGENIFSECRIGYDNIEISENSPVLKKNEHGVFSKNGRKLLIAFCNGNEKYTVPDGVIDIEYAAFKKGNNEEVVICEGVKVLKNYTFFWKHRLKSVILPDSIEVIGTDAFTSCGELSNVKMSRNLVEIQPYAFNGCQNIESLELPASLKTIGKNAFLNCDKLVITAPAGSYAIEYAKENSIKYKEI